MKLFSYRQLDKVAENNENLAENQEKRPNTPSEADEIGRYLTIFKLSCNDETILSSDLL